MREASVRTEIPDVELGKPNIVYCGQRTMRPSPAIGLMLVGMLGAQAPDLPPNVLFLSRAMRHIRQTMTAVPNFTCTETIYREELTPHSKKFEQLDVVRLEVAKVGSKEVFAWPGARRFEEKSVASFVAAGMIGDGIFKVVSVCRSVSARSGDDGCRWPGGDFRAQGHSR